MVILMEINHKDIGFRIGERRRKLNKSYFIIPHNSFIVNTNYITYYSKDRITLCEKYSIPIAYSKRAEFKRRFLMLLGE